MYSGVPTTVPTRVSVRVVERLLGLAAAHAEVEELHERQRAVRADDEDVLRLHVAVDDAERVRGFEAGEHLHRELDRLVGIETAHRGSTYERSVSP